MIDWTVKTYETVSSTQDVARQLGREGAPEGTVVVAGRQTAGRGREGNTWFSPPGTGLWMTCILRPEVESRDLPGLSILAAIAACEAVERCTGRAAGVAVKWPNDLYVRDRKLGGILCEAETSRGPLPSFVAAGIGINLSDPEEGFPAGIAPIATSIRRAFGAAVRSDELLTALLECLGCRYEDYRLGGFAPVREAFSRRDFLRGRLVVLRTGGRDVRGEARGVGEHGGLLLGIDRDRTQEFITGEVVRWEGTTGGFSEDIREGGSS